METNLYDFSEESINSREQNCKEIIRNIEIVSNTFFEEPSYRNIERAEDFIYRLLSVPMSPRFHNISSKNKNMYFKLSEKKNFYFEDINKYYEEHFNITLEEKSNNRAVYDTREIYNQKLIYFLLGTERHLYFIHYSKLLTANNIYNDDFKLIGTIICSLNKETHNIVAKFFPPKVSNIEIEKVSGEIKQNAIRYIEKNNNELAKHYFHIIQYIYNACYGTPLLRYIKLSESFVSKFSKNISDDRFLENFYPSVYEEKQQPIILNYSSSIVRILDDDNNIIEEFEPKKTIEFTSKVEQTGSLGNTPVNSTIFSEIIGLPETQEKTYYIVDKSVLYALPDTYRKDLLTPYNPIEDTKGNIIGYKGLLKNISRI